jgi:hypothetical protein
MNKIRIVARPAGEAPESVREAWVGLELPLLPAQLNRRRTFLTVGVLTGPRLWWQRLLSILLGRFERQSGYAVDALNAVNILATRDPDAAAWWRTNCAYLLDGRHPLVFAADVCEEF